MKQKIIWGRKEEASASTHPVKEDKEFKQSRGREELQSSKEHRRTGTNVEKVSKDRPNGKKNLRCFSRHQWRIF
ncbi:hypothetical protein CEXT_271881 [Caerostris extrusa]|uniref:Uncharacterized protein n=1 Tax=Caerostris extrusa TaxID=172846 RepID=A0AAV4NQG8_CAEEX|nr:hypothetical protein CEXT_271881 [Caerostris extrusa]